MIIGISGKLGSGKDLVASYIQKLVYEDSERKLFKTAFAYPLKRIVADTTGCMVAELSNREFKQKELPKEFHTPSMRTYRDMLQQVGSALGKVHPDFFIYSLFRSLASTSQKDFIITDVRFPNEVEAIKRMGGVVIRINREVSSEKHNNLHVSELALDNYQDFDYEINNRSDSYLGMGPSDSRDALKYKVEIALKKLNIIE